MCRANRANPVNGFSRLTQSTQFDWVKSHGLTLAKTSRFVLHGALPSCPSSPLPCLGQVVPKRWAKRAVTRNLIRRQVVAAFAHHAPFLPTQANVSSFAKQKRKSLNAEEGLEAVQKTAKEVWFVVRLRQTFARSEFISASSEVLRQAIRSELTHLFQQACQLSLLS
jgi:ribonuclease P protein component